MWHYPEKKVRNISNAARAELNYSIINMHTEFGEVCSWRSRDKFPQTIYMYGYFVIKSIFVQYRQLSDSVNI